MVQQNETRQRNSGVLMYSNSRVYEGYWENDRKHGYGYEEFASGAIYVGNYVNSKPHGFGKYVWSNGEIYEGEWVNGTKHGNGMWVGTMGDKYVGQWQQGKPHGQGVHTWINGDRYEGEFSECLKSGYGMEKFGNGDSYEGYYQNGKPEGHGKYSWKDGAVFKGQFQNGLRQGRGEYKGPRYNYIGNYENDKKHGEGEQHYIDGRVYRGRFWNDHKDGDGILEFPDGTKVKQKWKMGELLFEESEQRQTLTPKVTFKEPYLTQQFIKPKNKTLTSGQEYKGSSTSALLEQPSTSQRSMRARSIQQPHVSLSDPQQNKPHLRKLSQHGRPPVSQRSAQSQRPTRLRSQITEIPTSDDIFLQSQMPQGVQKSVSPIPMLRRPQELIRQKSPTREQTPESIRQEQKSILERPDFTLRFDQTQQTFKTNTGLKGRKTHGYNRTISQDEKSPPRMKLEYPNNKQTIRIRSITGTLSGNIRQITKT